jgi:hypothetical protein
MAGLDLHRAAVRSAAIAATVWLDLQSQYEIR